MLKHDDDKTPFDPQLIVKDVDRRLREVMFGNNIATTSATGAIKSIDVDDLKRVVKLLQLENHTSKEDTIRALGMFGMIVLCNEFDEGNSKPIVMLPKEYIPAMQNVIAERGKPKQ